MSIEAAEYVLDKFEQEPEDGPRTPSADVVKAIVAAWAGDRVLYVASRQLDTPCRHQHITNVREVYQGGEYQGNAFDVCEVQSAFVQVFPEAE